jgi:hypothetical protein
MAAQAVILINDMMRFILLTIKNTKLNIPAVLHIRDFPAVTDDTLVLELDDLRHRKYIFVFT